MRTLPRIGATLLVATLALILAPAVHAAELIANGGFEAGLLDWTTDDFIGSDGTFVVQTGTSSPVNGFPVPAPPEGVRAAMTDSLGPGSHVLFQDFTALAPVPTATLSFQLFVGNRADRFATPDTLDPFVTPALLNQQARVDILPAAADVFSVAAGDVLLNAFQTAVGDALVSGYTLHSVDVTALLNAHLGESLRLRFAEVDNVNGFNLGVDDVRLTVGSRVSPAPEPGSLLLVLAALAAAGLRGRASLGSMRASRGR